MSFFQIGVVGGGAWGTALASHCARMGHTTLLWARESEVVATINSEHQNHWFLPGITLPEGLKATEDLDEVMDHGEIILMVIPSQFVASTLGSWGSERFSLSSANSPWVRQVFMQVISFFEAIVK